MKCQLCPRPAVKIVESVDGSQSSPVCAKHLYHTIRIYSASSLAFTTRRIAKKGN